MRFIGGKSQLLDFIGDAIDSYTTDVHSVIDIFAGSGCVSSYLSGKNLRVISNDILYFSYCINRGTIGLKDTPKFENLGTDDVIRYLNTLRLQDTPFSDSDLFFTNNYSPNNNCSRMYFQQKNAVKIDIIRLTIENWKSNNLINNDEYYYLLACLINAVPYVANITGIYAAYLKYWDKRTYNDLLLEAPRLRHSAYPALCLNKDYRDISDVYADLTYADPPYNGRDYFPNYHILETLARYDYPDIKGVTGLRSYPKSPFCSKKNVERAFLDLIERADSRYVLISYNNEAILSTPILTDICRTYAKTGTFRLLERPYRRYKNKIPNNSAGLKEQLYFFEKK